MLSPTCEGGGPRGGDPGATRHVISERTGGDPKNATPSTRCLRPHAGKLGDYPRRAAWQPDFAHEIEQDRERQGLAALDVLDDGLQRPIDVGHRFQPALKVDANRNESTNATAIPIAHPHPQAACIAVKSSAA
jgi:hypothetical protein